jgi:hypothetical protein
LKLGRARVNVKCDPPEIFRKTEQKTEQKLACHPCSGKYSPNRFMSFPWQPIN